MCSVIGFYEGIVTLIAHRYVLPNTIKGIMMKKRAIIFSGLTQILTILLFLASTTPSYSQNSSLGQFEQQTDIGNVKYKGSTKYDPDTQTYTIMGSGYNMWFGHDEFHYVWERMKGDFIVRARAAFIGKGVEPHRKIGWMIRSSLDSTSAYVDAAVHGNGLTALQYRKTTGDSTYEIQSDASAPDIIQLERKGNTYIMSVAHFGEPFKTVRFSNIDLGDKVYVGLFVCSHNRNVKEKARFWNVRMVKPAWKGLVQYRDYLGSNLEIMDVKTGHRKIIYRENASLQAPNWTPDGNTLIYNKQGHLYNFDLTSNRSTLLYTDFATNNNNDHVLSWGGKMLGISDWTKSDSGRSNVYILPVAGGTPRRITPRGQSYLHGWSPDNKYLVYTAGRDGEFDIYKIPVDGGKEIRLTHIKELDDGPEYSPDGKYIFFCSTRSGTMQIWRMKPDGTHPERVTHDEFNDWFPHISPDGKWIQFISFTQKVAPDKHPFYKHVYLQLMPIDGGQPHIIAYLYGGQGTINVPSWSPDGKKIAFISNTDMTNSDQ